MVQVPPFLAVITPFDTVAIELLLVLHSNVLFVALLGEIVAVRVLVDPFALLRM